MIQDAFKLLWAQVEQERRAKIETAVEKMVTDPSQRGVLIIENQYGVIKSAELDNKVPFGQILIQREDLHVNGIVSPPAEGGGTT